MNDPYASSGDPTAAIMGMMGGFMLIWLVVIAFAIFCYWKIFSKAGYSGALSLLLLVPIANLVVVVWFAFADWPVLKRLRGETVT